MSEINKYRGAPRLIAGLLGLLVLAGCRAPQFVRDPIIGAGYTPTNVLSNTVPIPEDLRRVAVLPLTTWSDSAIATSGKEAMSPILRAELVQVPTFEFIFITEDKLFELTGKRIWMAEERLPQDFFTGLENETGCDAVMFCHLTQYHPYKPIIIGWRMKLIDSESLRHWWAIDEAFDAGEAAVMNSARRFYYSDMQVGSPLPNSMAILDSPRRFGTYTLDAVFDTMPAR
ncbi:MAG: hypothetical protein K9N48_01295 [Verrucomicrobia bacterium]|nr:hypothetical protein [Verrucomicrobiota bacterium]MCF7707287.1 hypothetical protein [Verrucomicrobiota bacterium]